MLKADSGNLEYKIASKNRLPKSLADPVITFTDTDIDSELLDNFTLEDFNLADIRRYQADLATNSSDNIEPDESIESFLERVGLIQTDRSTSERTKKFTKAALLLFGNYEAITSVFRYFFLDFIVKHQPEDVDYIDRVKTSSELGEPNNIYSFFNHVWDKLDSRVTNAFNISTDGKTRIDMGSGVKRVLREALVNSLVHADYADDSQIKISMYDKFIELTNPGEMRVSTQSFIVGGSSIARNPKIFNVFVRAKLGEHTGSGGRRIFDTITQFNLRQPDIKSDISKTTFVIWLVPLVTTIADVIDDRYRPTYLKVLDLEQASFRQLSQLYESSYHGHKILKEMLDKDLLGKTGANRYTKYYIKIPK
ncbi:MAG: hypothetical protein LBT80_02125 [Lactobacillaceae bacterium]|jgi:ATP-dependent DNA helicase RecG|nr:hypothetical protein [Lactobacillaceae bacterium]